MFTGLQHCSELHEGPLAQITKSGGTETVIYVHADHLMTPRYGTNAAGSTVWTWDSGAFGKEAPTGAATVNLRFPGQYYDAESTLIYNWNRYYNPATGRYISSDPIGLEGGLNTFGYVDESPLVLADPEGLQRSLPVPSYPTSPQSTPGYPGSEGPCFGFGYLTCDQLRALQEHLAQAANSAARGAVFSACMAEVLVYGTLTNQLYLDSAFSSASEYCTKVTNAVCGPAGATTNTSLEDVVAQKNQNDKGSGGDNTIPWFDGRKGRYSCICRSNYTGGKWIVGGFHFGYGFGYGTSVPEAQNNCRRMANGELGQADNHHTQYKCTNLKGERIR